MLRPSGKQLALAHWWHRPETARMSGVVAEGAVRSGKTYAMIVGFLTWSRSAFEGQNFILAGKSVGALKRNVVQPMLAVMRQMGWRYSYNRSELFVECGGNVYYLFGASNEASQDVLQGITAAGCLADEVALFPKSFVDQMAARCSVEGAKMWFDCNPSYPTHFFKTEWVDRADELGLLLLHFDMRDNPALSDGTRERYERMFTGVFRDRYVLGLWTLAEGLVYPDYRDAMEPRFELSKEGEDGVERPTYVRLAVSCDYGTQNAFAALLWAYDGRTWHAVREYRHSGRDTGHQKTDADYVADMREFARDAPEGTPFIVDPSAASFIAAMRREGFKVRKARNDVMDGIRETGAAMSLGLVRIADDLEETAKELAGYVWDDRAGGDRPVKADDHLMDAMRYLVATVRAVRPAEEYASPFDKEQRWHLR